MKTEEGKRIFANSVFKANITQIPKSEKKIIGKQHSIIYKDRFKCLSDVLLKGTTKKYKRLTYVDK